MLLPLLEDVVGPVERADVVVGAALLVAGPEGVVRVADYELNDSTGEGADRRAGIREQAVVIG